MCMRMRRYSILHERCTCRKCCFRVLASSPAICIAHSPLHNPLYSRRLHTLCSHGRQYQVFQKLVATYETDPGNFPRLMELMQDLQAYGQPPRELLRALAPGLELTADGLPLLLPQAALAGGGGGGGGPAGLAAAVPLGGCSVM